MHRKKIIGLFCGIFVLTASFVYGQVNPPAVPVSSKPTSPVSARPAVKTEYLTGRISLDKTTKTEKLILVTKDAKAYMLTGVLSENIKQSLAETGKNNLFTVEGKLNGMSNVFCEKTYKYIPNPKGKKDLKVAARCIRYYHLEVTRVVSAKKSCEVIPPPKRDTEEEDRLLKVPETQNITPLVTGEIQGKISALNLKTPVKNLEITNRNKQSAIKKITLLIDSQTRIVRKNERSEPVAAGVNTLKEGQEVAAVYCTKDDLTNQGLFITITKE
ncbi:MAG: hypothetical protein WC510_03925 [Candidatus Omnitrophota bacterium]